MWPPGSYDGYALPFNDMQSVPRIRKARNGPRALTHECVISVGNFGTGGRVNSVLFTVPRLNPDLIPSFAKWPLGAKRLGKC